MKIAEDADRDISQHDNGQNSILSYEERLATIEKQLIEEFPQARTALARLALKARAEYIASGAPLLSIDEINLEVARRRYGRSDEDE